MQPEKNLCSKNNSVAQCLQLGDTTVIQMKFWRMDCKSFYNHKNDFNQMLEIYLTVMTSKLSLLSLENTF